MVPENVELHSPLSISIEAESPLSRKLIYSIVRGNELEEFTLDFNTGKCHSLNCLSCWNPHFSLLSIIKLVSID